MKKNKRLPKFLQSVLWSYNLNEMDLEEDKEIIITQVLNYGSWKELKWLYSVYSEEEIKKVVTNPQRGLWFEKVLNFWEVMFGIHLPDKVRQRAIFSVQPKSMR